jgi:membrane-associated phospholipid phosphatase
MNWFVKHRAAAGGLLYAAVFALLTAFDYPIELALTRTVPYWWQYFGKCIAILPGILIAAWCSVVLARQETGWKKILYTALYLFFCIYTALQFSKYSQLPFRSPAVLILLGSALVLVFLLSRKPAELTPEGKRVLWIGILLLCLQALGIDLLKALWGRPRYAFLSETGKTFIPWYRINGPVWSDDRLRSFPSGHTGAASVMLWITLLPYLFPGLKKKRALLLGIAAAWILMTMVGRIGIGAHYATDVWGGFGISLALFELLKHRLLVKKTDDNRAEV